MRGIWLISAFNATMTGYHFTNHARQLLAAAQEESRRLRHPRVGTEHLLLAISRDPGPTLARVLTNLRVPPAQLAHTLDGMVVAGTHQDADRPFADRLWTVVDMAMAEARQEKAEALDSPHLLLGLLGEGKGIGAQVLQDCGITIEATRRELAVDS